MSQLPREWSHRTLEELATIERGRFSARPRNDPKYYGGTVPFVQTGDIAASNGRLRNYSQTLNDAGLKVSKVFPANTILMTIAANIGDTAITNFPVACPDSLVGFRCKDQVDVEWLNYTLCFFKAQIDQASTQNAQKNINLERLKPLAVPVPPHDEQKKIAEILSTWDRGIEAYDSYLKRLSALLTTKTRQLFLSLNDDPVALGTLGKWVGGGTPSKANAAFWKNGTIPWVSPKDMKTFEVSTAEDYITEEAVSSSSTTLVPKGSILLVTRSGILRHTLPVGISMRPVAINQDLKALTPTEGINVHFVAHYLQAHQDNVLQQCAKVGTTVESLDFEALKAFEMPLPPRSRQDAIARLLGSIHRLKVTADLTLAALKKQKQGLMQQLLTGKVRVKA